MVKVNTACRCLSGCLSSCFQNNTPHWSLHNRPIMFERSHLKGRHESSCGYGARNQGYNLFISVAQHMLVTGHPQSWWTVSCSTCAAKTRSQRVTRKFQPKLGDISRLVVGGQLICTNVTLTHVSHSGSHRCINRAVGGGGLGVHFQGKLND